MWRWRQMVIVSAAIVVLHGLPVEALAKGGGHGGGHGGYGHSGHGRSHGHAGLHGGSHGSSLNQPRQDTRPCPPTFDGRGSEQPQASTDCRSSTEMCLHNREI